MREGNEIGPTALQKDEVGGTPEGNGGSPSSFWRAVANSCKLIIAFTALAIIWGVGAHLIYTTFLLAWNLF